jgi:hypothetical protein
MAEKVEKALRYAFPYVIAYWILTIITFTMVSFYSFVQVSQIPVLVEYVKWLNPGFGIPATVIAWFWTLLSGAYVGTDRIAQIAKTHNLENGNSTYGNMNKMKKIIILNYLLCIYALVLVFVFPIDLPLEALFTAVGATTVLLVSGQKGVAIAVETQDKDLNNDGVDDLLEDIEKFTPEQQAQIRKRVEALNNLAAEKSAGTGAGKSAVAIDISDR